MSFLYVFVFGVFFGLVGVLFVFVVGVLFVLFCMGVLFVLFLYSFCIFLYLFRRRFDCWSASRHRGPMQAAAAGRAVFDLVPAASPLFAPGKRQSANSAEFCWKMRLAMHGLLKALPSERPSHRRTSETVRGDVLPGPEKASRVSSHDRQRPQNGASPASKLLRLS